MNKVIREVDEEKGIVQVTTVNERWYIRDGKNPTTGLPEYQFVPSVTWIAGHYPRGIGFYKWLASVGWDESQAIKQAAGDKGSKVHYAIGDLIDGKTVAMDAKYVNPSTGQEEELTLEEYECLMAFREWFLEAKPETIARELVVWNDDYGYAGTIDYLCRIGGVPYLIDFKTSQDVWPEYEMQVSAYKHALIHQNLKPPPETNFVDYKLAILQVGYKRNKTKKWKFTEVEDQFDLFLASQRIWQKEASGQAPLQRDYPVALSLTPPSPKPEPTAKPGKVTKKAA